MTVSIESDDDWLFDAEDDQPKPKNLAKAILKEFQDMSAAMVAEEGLLNHAQAGLFLEVSTKRISELVRLGKLTRFDFVGRTYVSFKEVRARRELDLKAGRPPRGLMKKVVLGIKAAAKTDLTQALVEGLGPDYEITKTTKSDNNEK